MAEALKIYPYLRKRLPFSTDIWRGCLAHKLVNAHFPAPFALYIYTHIYMNCQKVPFSTVPPTKMINTYIRHMHWKYTHVYGIYSEYSTRIPQFYKIRNITATYLYILWQTEGLSSAACHKKIQVCSRDIAYIRAWKSVSYLSNSPYLIWMIHDGWRVISELDYVNL